MNKKILSVLLLFPVIVSTNPTVKKIKTERKAIEKIQLVSHQPLEEINLDEILITALIEVESLGNDSAIGDRHLAGNEAVGALQIRPIMVREVNRILKIKKVNKKYKLRDRFNRDKTIEMFLIWKNHHHPEGGFETIARNWNGGPRGYKNPRTEKYWIKVQKELNK
jgi:hypothetical protein